MNQYKNLYAAIAGVASLAVLLLLSSCNEDAIIEGDVHSKVISNNISFGISNNDSWSETRSVDGCNTTKATVASNFVLHGSDSSDSLFVRATIRDFETCSPENAASHTRATLASNTNMHASFGVTACIYSNESQESAYYFFNEKNTMPNDESPEWIYDSGNTYYWPGANHKLHFYAYAPYACTGLTPPTNNTPGAAPVFSFTVPENAENQTDLLVADSGEKSGNSNTFVPLTFNHICTAVEFIEGADMQPGTIQSVTIKGVSNSGSYSFETGEWTLETATADFVQEINKSTTQTSETEITSDNNCFVMLPQTLPEGATIEILFADAITGTDRLLTASIAGHVWPQGKRVRYKISISPDYDFDITVPEMPQDAHYIICKVSVTGNLPSDKQWLLEAEASDGVKVTLLSELSSHHANGFWTDRILFQANNSTTTVDQGSARGESTLKANGAQVAQDVFVFIPENVGKADRTITLTLQADGYPGTRITKTLQQRYPDWSGGSFGWEQFENDPLVTFGFKWDYTVTFRKKNTFLSRWIYTPLVKNLVTQHKAEVYAEVSEEYVFFVLLRTIVEIDYSKLNSLSGIDINNNNGLQNTRNLYTYSGSATTGEFEQAIRDLAKRGENGVFEEIPSGTKDMESAVLGYILKKNRYNLLRVEKSDAEATILSESPAIDINDIVWYLPAIGQFSSAPSENALTGTYWSSNPDLSNNSTQAYTSDGRLVDRLSEYKVRACRNAPTN